MANKDVWRHYEVVGENRNRKKIIVSESQIYRILQEIASDEIDIRANEANTTPTDAQKEAGNYKMGHIFVKGMQIAIENPKGSYRKYKDEKGNDAYNLMHNHYGYFNVTKGKDGDAVDVFIGPDIDNFENVYCVDQNNKKGEFDETKVMLGFTSKEQAKQAYLSNYSPTWEGFRDITGVSLKVFKKWLYRGRKQRQPFKDYVYIQKKKITENKVANPEKYQAFQDEVAKIEKWIMQREGEGGVGFNPNKRDYGFWLIVFEFDGGRKNENPNQFVVKAVSRALANLKERGVKLNYYTGV
jgi:hypothetical protein